MDLRRLQEEVFSTRKFWVNKNKELEAKVRQGLQLNRAILEKSCTPLLSWSLLVLMVGGIPTGCYSRELEQGADESKPKISAAERETQGGLSQCRAIQGGLVWIWSKSV